MTEIYPVLNLGRLDHQDLLAITELHEKSHNEIDSFLRELYSCTPKTIEWKCNSLFCKNNMMTSFYFDLFSVIYAKIRFENGNVSKVVVKNSAQYEALLPTIGKERLELASASPRSAYEGLLMLKVASDVLKNLRRGIHEFSLRSSKRAKKFNLNKPIVLVDTFWLEDSFKSGRFTDRYFPHLVESLPEKWEGRVFFLPNLLSKKDFRKRLKIQEAAGISNLFRHDFLNLRDYFEALICCLRLVPTKLNHIHFFKVDVTPLIRRELRLNRAHPSSFDAILNYRFWLRVRERKIRVSLLIDWYENHAVDKGMQAGRIKFSPATRSIGYQGVVYDYGYHNCARPGKLEKMMEVLPDRIALVGKWILKDCFGRSGPVELCLAPGFRFWNKERQVPAIATSDKSEEKATVLVVLPIDDIVSKEMLRQITSVQRKLDQSAIDWKILPHPLTDKSLLDQMGVSEWGTVGHGLRNYLNKASLVIGGGSSSSYIECLIAGVPVVIVTRSVSDFLQFPIPKQFPIKKWISCGHLDDIDLLEMIREHKAHALSDESVDIVDFDLFEPVTQAGIQSLFGQISKSN